MSSDEQLTGTWVIDPQHSRLGFSSRHAMVSRIRGAFNTVEGKAVINAEDLSKTDVTLTIDVDSIDTRTPDRDAHLRSADFFDVENYPTITFKSTGVDEVEEGSYIVNGDLTIRDVTRPVSVPLEMLGIDRDQNGALRAGFEGKRRIDRKDWGVTWNTTLDSGGLLVSDKITLEFELSLIKE
ncbi:MAG: YceI family protein [Brevibacterium aurantiacum]|uniref:Polyisoprenoid-binding protein n=1 Tax=Brevibacterium aurantiacum TaxID=273384 RepID=A0A368M104_BREAU|nr:YceI family protein [Brevibacterium aurantiacum]AZT97301.1 polyisoprenoid-binding protein [Brevibacterium aurantiacum]PCC58807.1 polyisoprenoid-binding protein [Brevibacterium aurantiacum]RCS92655.1 polyisoprenoid-binding protein [Brevibacterium aurantiacum]